MIVKPIRKRIKYFNQEYQLLYSRHVQKCVDNGGYYRCGYHRCRTAGDLGTAALVGVFKAYQEMTGETINADIIDASLNELVVTGQLEQSIAGLSDEEVEEFIAYIKSVIAQNDLKDEASINQAIDDACSKYNVTLSDSSVSRSWICS